MARIVIAMVPEMGHLNATLKLEALGARGIRSLVALRYE
jgi:hypothetical protein